MSWHIPDTRPMPPKQGFYAVARGRQPGVYHTWPECEAQVKGHAGAAYKKFSTLEGGWVKHHEAFKA